MFQLRFLVLSALVISVAGCKLRSEPSPESETVEAQITHAVAAYPPARWRLARPARLHEVLIWVSHIVVRHREARSFDPCFNFADWHSGREQPTRSRLEALAIAEKIAREAAEAPESFARLAALYSEDIATQPLGGSLGGVRASHLSPFPEVLDALSATLPGQVSKVVETRYGFHVFYRRPAPPEGIVSGSRIVIAHDQAGWIEVVARGPRASRSRDTALALANELYARAKEHPERFGDLVEQYSEHVDALRGGDMGTWSAREASDYPRETELLASLAIGEVTPPLDSPVGFQIIRRDADRPRRLYAMEQVRLSFDPALPDSDPASRAAALAKASGLAAEIAKAPARFGHYQSTLCCRGPEQWRDGRGSPALTNALDALLSGEITPQPIQSESAFVIAKRIEPRPEEEAPLMYELPRPLEPDVAYWLSHGDGDTAEAELGAIAREVQAALGLTGARASAFLKLHQIKERFDRAIAPVDKVAVFHGLLADVKGLLRDPGYPRYVAAMNAHFERRLLDPRREL